VDISAEVEQKWKVIRAHKSQFYDPDSNEPETILSQPSFLEGIETRMRYWGTQIGVSHAEPFLTTEPFAVPDLIAAMG
jgi:LmbE family N-acetylglucosaminyl deacetylase